MADNCLFNRYTTPGYIDLATISDFKDFHLSRILGVKTSPSYTTIQSTKDVGLSDYSSTHTFDCSSSIIHKISLRFLLPEIRLKDPGNFKRLRWTRNLAHNLIEKISLKHDEKEVWTFDSISIDYINAFRKGDDYYRLIGNIPELINPTSISPEKGICLPSVAVHLPLDFQSQPIVFQGLNNASLVIKYRKIEDVLTVDDFLSGISRPVHETDLVSMPKILIALTEDHKLFDRNAVPRLGKQVFNSTNIKMSEVGERFGGKDSFIDLNAQGMVHCMYFGVRNISNLAEHSNYSAIDPYLQLKCIDGLYVPGGVDFEWKERDVPKNKIRAHLDSLYIMPDLVWTIMSYYDADEKEIRPNPIWFIKLFYEGSTRLCDRDDFFSQLHPYNIGGKIPAAPGYHMYCFSPDINKIDCVTNFNKLTIPAARYYLNRELNPAKFSAFAITHMLVGP
jgi:Large eukaryotic DNA virus major capsid protein